MARATVIPFGPQHAAFLEPVNVKLTLEEEKVVGAELNQGYNHRGMEYALSLDYRKSQYLAERVCGICSFHHSSAYCQGVEMLYQVDVPERAKLIRTIMMECQRLTSHLLALGHIAEAVGYENLFMQCFREREYVMMLVNRLSGNRVHYSMNVSGPYLAVMEVARWFHLAFVYGLITLFIWSEVPLISLAGKLALAFAVLFAAIIIDNITARLTRERMVTFMLTAAVGLIAINLLILFIVRGSL